MPAVPNLKGTDTVAFLTVTPMLSMYINGMNDPEVMMRICSKQVVVKTFEQLF